MKFQVWGVHPESDCEWLVSTHESYQKAAQDILYLPEIDFGLGFYEVRREGEPLRYLRVE